MKKDNNNEETLKCYTQVASKSVPCKEKDCRHFLNSNDDLNCSIIAANDGPKTLQEIGDYYGISRMRICQIEKAILKKLRREKSPMSLFKPLAGEKTNCD